jgi:hypothetical protein
MIGLTPRKMTKTATRKASSMMTPRNTLIVTP